MSLIKFLDEVRARLKAATPGPWVSGEWQGLCCKDHVHGLGDCEYEQQLRLGSYNCVSMENESITVVITTSEYGALSKANSVLIASAPTDLDKFVRICEVQRKALENIKFDRGTTAEKTNANNYHFAASTLDEADEIARGVE